MHLWRRKLRLAAVAVTAAVAVVAAGCGGSSGSSGTSSSGGTAVKGGTMTWAELPSTVPNWIFPFSTLTYFSVANSQNFQMEMYRPLYWFGGNNTSPTVDYGLSVANAPVYSDGGKTIVINLKGYKWSNGETVNAQDVLFWLHMMVAEKTVWAGYSPGGIPDNITSMSATGPLQVTLHLNKAYSSLWYTYNELSQVTPMPMAWDVTSTGAKAGSGGCTTDTRAVRQVQGRLQLPHHPVAGDEHVHDQPDLDGRGRRLEADLVQHQRQRHVRAEHRSTRAARSRSSLRSRKSRTPTTPASTPR